MSITLTRRDAEQALAAIKAEFNFYLVPMTIGDTEYPAECPEPVLVEDQYDAPFAIVWEDGPSEWAYRATSGGASEEEQAIYADASAEFGVSLTTPEHEPVTFPARVHAEPYYSFVLTLHAN